MNKVLISLITITLLSGCKVELAPTVNLSDLNSETAQKARSKLIVSVTNCNDYRNPQNESADITNAKKTVSKVFSEAIYLKCYKDNIISKAVFEVPIIVGGKSRNEGIQIRNTDTGGGMIVEMSDNFKQKINKASKSAFSKLSSDIYITVNNDLNKDQDIIAHAVYLDGKPTLVARYTLKPGNHTFKLSDVSISSIFSNGSALVYEDANKQYQ
ncbi:hypothetical protein A9G48_10725 [Gilliamella sp. wkB18]|uniref:DUF7424 family protein n=1 Tax=Gilliamella sp. wkB18 TaxID=3120260 RepID=UPI0004DCC348|nr:hypothetical protein [Gilliamella apicola]KFA59772.1 hypothetical protein GAPWKB11_0515 [Gilliamella apicola]OCG65447.1 hypothetical protein A9G48_10725 [Gilliamella apicola]